MGIEALGQCLDEFGRARRGRGRADFVVRGIRFAEANVVPNIGREDDRLLRHQAEPIAHGQGVRLPNVHVIDADFTAARVVEPQQQVEDGRFART